MVEPTPRVPGQQVRRIAPVGRGFAQGAVQGVPCSHPLGSVVPAEFAIAVQLLTFAEQNADRRHRSPKTGEQRLDLGLHDDAGAPWLRAVDRALEHGDVGTDRAQFVCGCQTPDRAADHERRKGVSDDRLPLPSAAADIDHGALAPATSAMASGDT